MMISTRQLLARTSQSTLAILVATTMAALPTAWAQSVPTDSRQQTMPGDGGTQSVAAAKSPVLAGMPRDGIAMRGSSTMPLPLSASPGDQQLYHVGAAGFFVDQSEVMHLDSDQQSILNAMREKALVDLATAQSAIDHDEQELWMLTGSDRPDSIAIEVKVREIERRKGDRRIAFIRSVGEAARVLTDDQRSALLGASPPEQTRATAPQGFDRSMTPQGDMAPAKPPGGMAGMADDSMGNKGGGMGDM